MVSTPCMKFGPEFTKKENSELVQCNLTDEDVGWKPPPLLRIVIPPRPAAGHKGGARQPRRGNRPRPGVVVPIPSPSPIAKPDKIQISITNLSPFPYRLCPRAFSPAGAPIAAAGSVVRQRSVRGA